MFKEYKKIVTDVSKHVRRLWPYVLTYKKWAALTVLFVLLKEGLMLAEPAIFRQIVGIFESYYAEAITQNQALYKTLWLMGGFVALHVGVVVANTFMFRSVNRLDSSVMRDAANDFVQKVLNLSFRFHSERQTGRLAKEFARGVIAIETFLDAFVFSLIPLAMRLFTIFVVFAFID